MVLSLILYEKERRFEIGWSYGTCFISIGHIEKGAYKDKREQGREKNLFHKVPPEMI
jgi:hypothetical protein